MNLNELVPPPNENRFRKISDILEFELHENCWHICNQMRPFSQQDALAIGIVGWQLEAKRLAKEFSDRFIGPKDGIAHDTRRLSDLEDDANGYAIAWLSAYKELAHMSKRMAGMVEEMTRMEIR